MGEKEKPAFKLEEKNWLERHSMNDPIIQKLLSDNWLVKFKL